MGHAEYAQRESDFDNRLYCPLHSEHNRDLYHSDVRERRGVKNEMGDTGELARVEGLTFDIQRYSIHDGPGIRTTVFLKGCPLRCRWCHNPESMGCEPVLFFTRQRCIGCGTCRTVCPNAAAGQGGEESIDRDRCRVCGRCAEACPPRALEIVGRVQSVADVMKEVEADIPFYEKSGGGMTVSGGEPLAQPRFLKALLEYAKLHSGLHTAIDTSGYCRYEVLESILPFTDLILYDIKHMDSSRHRELTGVPNELILENLRRVAGSDVSLDVRVPVIPGCNSESENMERTAMFIATLPKQPTVTLLPYHALAGNKYQKMGIAYQMEGAGGQDRESLVELKELFERYGLTARLLSDAAARP